MKKTVRDDSMSFSEDGEDGGHKEIYRQKYTDITDENSDPNQYLMTEEESESSMSERLVVRIVPKAIDYAIFLIQLTILASFFYVSYIWDGLNGKNQTICVADINSDEPLDPTSVK